MFSLSANLIDFDPDLIDVIISFFAVAGKYAMVIAICVILMTMLIRAFKGKERFL